MERRKLLLHFSGMFFSTTVLIDVIEMLITNHWKLDSVASLRKILICSELAEPDITYMSFNL